MSKPETTGSLTWGERWTAVAKGAGYAIAFMLIAVGAYSTLEAAFQMGRSFCK